MVPDHLGEGLGAADVDLANMRHLLYQQAGAATIWGGGTHTGAPGKGAAARKHCITCHDISH